MRSISWILIVGLVYSCSKGGSTPPPPPPPPSNFSASAWSVNGLPQQALYYDINKTPAVRFNFNAPIDRSSIAAGIVFKENGGTPVNFTASYEKSDSVVILQPNQTLTNISKYLVTVSSALKSKPGGSFIGSNEIAFITSIDSTDKFPILTDDNLLTLVQQQTFKYFWDFGHPVSGLARERNNSGDIVTSGGSGFGVMAMIVAIIAVLLQETKD